MQRIGAAGGKVRVHVDQVAHPAHLGGENDLVAAQAVVLGGGGGFQRAHHDGLQHHLARRQRLLQLIVLVHHLGQQRLVERAPVDADAHRLLVFDSALDHDAEVVVVLAANGDVAGVDAVLGQRPRRGGKFFEQQVAVVVEVADDGHAQAALVQAFDDVRNGRGGLLVVHRDAHDLRAGQRQGRYLFDGARYVRRVGVGHRLHDDRNLPAHANLSDSDCAGFSTLNLRHASSLPATSRSSKPEGSFEQVLGAA
jgi:hypothetical protein